MSNRATPEMWSNYSAACGMFNVILTGVPQDTLVNMTENFLNSERNKGLWFTRSNKLKIGFNCLSNHLQKVYLALKNNLLKEWFLKLNAKSYLLLMSLLNFKIQWSYKLLLLMRCFFCPCLSLTKLNYFWAGYHHRY